MIADLSTSGAFPALELTLRYAGARQKLIASNIANLSTPDYRQVDVPVADFRRALSAAVETRRAETGGASGELRFDGGSAMAVARDGRLDLNPTQSRGGILFHDRNNRNLEALMQDQAENAATFRVAVDMLRTRAELLRSAISERI